MEKKGRRSRRWHLYQRYTCFTQKSAAVFIWVQASVDNPFDPCIDDHFGTREARLVRHINHTAPGADSVQRRLDDGVLLGVERSDTVPVYNQMSDIVTVGQACGRTVVSSCQDAFVAHDHRANVGA